MCHVPVRAVQVRAQRGQEPTAPQSGKGVRGGAAIAVAGEDRSGMSRYSSAPWQANVGAGRCKVAMCTQIAVGARLVCEAGGKGASTVRRRTSPGHLTANSPTPHPESDVGDDPVNRRQLLRGALATGLTGAALTALTAHPPVAGLGGFV